MDDDRIPEERQEHYTQLIALLRRGLREQAMTMSASEQARMIARVHERLAPREALSPQSEDLPFHQSPVQTRSGLIVSPSARRGQLARFAQDMVAVLVVGMLLGAALLVFRAAGRQNVAQRQNVTQTPTGFTGPTAVSQFNGLQASIQVVTPGPYFLTELVTVEVGLTNHTGRPVELAGANKPDSVCWASALTVQLTAGSAPTFTLPELAIDCLQSLIVTTLEPGQTLTLRYSLPLTKSGAVTITMGGMQEFPPPARGTPNPYDPYVGHWPVVSIPVDPQVPANRELSVRSQGGQVIVQGPPAALTQLLYLESISCDHYSGGGLRLDWSPLPTAVLSQPACPTAHKHWVYLVGAPGYTIVTGTQDS